MKTHTWRAGQFIYFVLTRGRNEKYIGNDTNCGIQSVGEIAIEAIAKYFHLFGVSFS